MSTEQDLRVERAVDALRVAVPLLLEIRHIADPVAQRKALVRCAKALRAAANELDQHGFLVE